MLAQTEVRLDKLLCLISVLNTVPFLFRKLRIFINKKHGSLFRVFLYLDIKLANQFSLQYAEAFTVFILKIGVTKRRQF